MARPVKARSTEAFARDLATLAHLRTSILIDHDLDSERARLAITHIDELSDILLQFSREKESGNLKISG